MAGGDEDGVDGIAIGAFEMVPLEQAVRLGVADDRFDGVSPSQLAPASGRCDAAGMADVDFGLALMLVAPVAAIDVSAADRDTGNPLDLGDLAGERVPVVGIARQGVHAEDELAAPGSRVDHRDRGLDAKLVPRARLALGDALDLGAWRA